jgi:8-oxo-dGTP pyrophosphatase MutT (NUDIX family)
VKRIGIEKFFLAKFSTGSNKKVGYYILTPARFWGGFCVKLQDVELPYRENASIIAQQNGKYLLVRKPRRHHAWQFPQGGREAGETYEETALREFTEELGCSKVEILKEAGVYQYDFPVELKQDPHYKSYRGQTVHLFLANFVGKESEIQVDGKEIVEYRFVTPAEIATLIESPAYLQIIQSIISSGKN